MKEYTFKASIDALEERVAILEETINNLINPASQSDEGNTTTEEE